MNDEHGSTLGAGGKAGPGNVAGTSGGVDGIVYPVEFELRVIYLLSEGASLSAGLRKVLTEQHASPGDVRELAAPAGKSVPGGKYGRLACPVRFETKEGMYAAYAAVGALPGVKTVL
jgi:hypothetical protein